MQLTTELLLAVVLGIVYLAFLSHVLHDSPNDTDEDKPHDLRVIIGRNNDVQADCDVRLHNVQIKTGVQE